MPDFLDFSACSVFCNQQAAQNAGFEQYGLYVNLFDFSFVGSTAQSGYSAWNRWDLHDESALLMVL